MRYIIILAIVFTLALNFSLLTGCKRGANEYRAEKPKVVQPTQPTQPTTPAKPIAADPIALELAIDQTASGDMTVLKPVVEALMQAVEAQHVMKVGTVRLGEGGKTSFAGTVQVFDLPLPPSGTFDAQAEEKKIEQSCWARLRCREERINKARDKFESELQEKTRQAAAQRHHKSLEIADLLLAPPLGAATCTNVIGFRDRLLTDGYRLIVLITDGDHTCQSEFDTKRFPADRRILILQLPLKGETSEEAFGARTRRLQEIFVGEAVSVIPAVTADRDLLARFLGQS